MEDSKEASTQTESDLHDIFYYKSRAFKAEEALLNLKKLQYIEKLQSGLRELEKDTASKLRLYSYNADKTHQLQHDFQMATGKAEQLQLKATDIYNFNLQALRNGHELNELPRIDDAEVDLDSYHLGPVTPTINPHRNPIYDSPLLPQAFPQAGSFSLNGISFAHNRFPAPAPYPYNLYQHNENLSQGFIPSAPLQPTFNLPAQSNHGNAIGSHRPSARVAEMSDVELGDFRGEEILRMISIDGPRSDFIDGAIDPSRFSGANTALAYNGEHAAPSRQPDVVPRMAKASSPSNSGALGLDCLDLDFGVPADIRSGQQKWSQIAAPGPEAVADDSEWQAVGSRKTRPTQIKSHHKIFGFKPDSDGAMFETMVEGIMEKYQLTRPEVIAVLQRVRNERNGDMNVPLYELMRDAEKLFSQNKNVLKPTSLTARARAVADHAEPCDNQLCPARLKLLKYRTEYCLSYQTTGACHMKPGSCVYAHGEAELRPLPKDELCERYLEGKCSNKKCVYAHGASELKNRPMINTAEYMKTKSKKPVNSLPSNKIPTVDDLMLTTADRDSQGEECTICMDTMSKKSRKKLDCGHDSFHYKCLKRWVAMEGDRSCPLCRSNALLPEEYPRLGTH